MNLDGRRVLVTGASSGIGRATARAFGAAGAEVVLVARRADRLAELKAELGGAADAITADLSEPGAAAAVAERTGPVDVLVNNAGSEAGGPVWAVGDREEARRMFEVDWWSPLALTAALVPGMRERGEGVVVNVTSIRQVVSWPALGHSGAAKAALAHVTETLRLELAGSGVAVVEVVPGPVETPALGASRLLPGFVELLDGIFGTGTPERLAELIVQAVGEARPRVFYPAEVENGWRAPAALRAEIAAAAREAPPMPDGLVIGPDHPILADSKANWENTR